MPASSLLRWIYPPSCASCSATAASPFCHVCSQSLYPITSACPSCALPVEGPRSLACSRCRRRPPPLDGASAAFRYGAELATSLRRLKFSRRTEVARALAPLIAPYLARAVSTADVIVPVPLHWTRLARRGFNQSTLLIAHASGHLEATPPLRAVLRRRRATRPQSGLDLGQRKVNVHGAFALRRRGSAAVSGRSVLVVDDVMTTGATMFEAARALRRAGAIQVHAFCIARADG